LVCTRSTASLRSKISGFSPPNESADLGFDGLPLNIWKEADPDIPILKQAKAEYAKLQQLIVPGRRNQQSSGLRDKIEEMRRTDEAC
jgi:hypothetical protein